MQFLLKLITRTIDNIPFSKLWCKFRKLRKYTNFYNDFNLIYFPNFKKKISGPPMSYLIRSHSLRAYAPYRMWVVSGGSFLFCIKQRRIQNVQVGNSKRTLLSDLCNAHKVHVMIDWNATKQGFCQKHLKMRENSARYRYIADKNKEDCNLKNYAKILYWTI